MSQLHDHEDQTPRKPEARDVLLACGLCDGASERAIHTILDGSHLAHAQRGETLWTAGTEARFFLIVAEGLVRLSRRAPHAHEVVVELVGPGSCAGILAALSSGVYPLTAISVTGTWYLKIPISVWHDVLHSEPQLMDSAINELRRRLLESYDFLGGMATCAVEQRLASALLSVHEVLCSPLLDKPEALPISRQCLAEIASTSVETVIRTTTKWQSQGWIEAGYRTIRIVDMDAIRGLLD